MYLPPYPTYVNGVPMPIPQYNPNYNPTSDNYLDWFNRFEAQLNSGPWHGSCVSIPLSSPTRPGQRRQDTRGEADLAQQLENRYIDNFG